MEGVGRKTNVVPDASVVDQTPRHRLLRGGLRHGPGISWDESLGHSGVPAKQLRTVTNIDKTLGPEPLQLCRFDQCDAPGRFGEDSEPSWARDAEVLVTVPTMFPRCMFLCPE